MDARRFARGSAHSQPICEVVLFLCTCMWRPAGVLSHDWVLVVVVVVVVVKGGSGPESGIGSTRSFFGVHLGCFCVYFSSSGNIV